MCNKRRSFPKNNVRNVILYLSLITFFLIGCTDQDVSEHKNDVILTEYPALADAVVARDFNSLLTFKDHTKPEVSDAAWRALAQTPTDVLSSFLNHVISTDTHNAWFTLSMHSLNEEQLDLIASEFVNERIRSSSICEVFYRQGGEEALGLLSDFPRKLADNHRCALAVSTIVLRSEVEDDAIIFLFDRAFDADDSEFRRSLIYGFYRASADGPIFNPSMASEISQ